MFVFNPGLLLNINNLRLGHTSLIIITAILGVVYLAACIQKYLYIELKFYERISLLLSAFLLISTIYLYSGLGALLLGVVLVLQVIRSRGGDRNLNKG
jgi:TRAP-type uncharacterized transport system fused permease subunit